MTRFARLPWKKIGIGVALPLAVILAFAAGTSVDLLTQVKHSCSSGVSVFTAASQAMQCDANWTDTGSALVSTEQITAPSMATTGSGAGQMGFAAGTGQTSIASNVAIEGPATVTTAYNLRLPNTPGALGALVVPAPSGGNNDAQASVFPELQAQTGSSYTNATTTASTFQSQPIAASQNESVTCELTYQASTNTTPLKLYISTPASPTSVNLEAVIYTNQSGTETDGPITSSGGSFTGANPSVSSTTYRARLTGTVENGSTAGTMAVQASAGAAGTITIGRGSFCLFHQF